MRTGCQWMFVDTTTGTERYPSNGIGGTTATSASNATIGARAVKVYGFTVIASGAGATTITLGVDNGADGMTAGTGLAFGIAAGQATPFSVPLGGPDGLVLNGPLAASTTSTTTFLLYYEKLL